VAVGEWEPATLRGRRRDPRDRRSTGGARVRSI